MEKAKMESMCGELFFKNLYVMDIRTNRPVFYKGEEVQSYDDIEFIIKE